MQLTTIEATYFAKKIKERLIEMAIDGELPMDMNEFDDSIIQDILLGGGLDETDEAETDENMDDDSDKNDWTNTEMIGV